MMRRRSAPCVLVLLLLVVTPSGALAQEKAGGSIDEAVAEADETDERFMALNLYHEARSGGEDSMTAVGWVVLNRIEDKGYPNDISAVITQGGESPPCEFGWWCDGRSDEPYEAEEWEKAQEVARRLLSRERPADPTGGAVWFQRSELPRQPWMDETIERTTTIGGHDFFKRTEPELARSNG